MKFGELARYGTLTTVPKKPKKRAYGSLPREIEAAVNSSPGMTSVELRKLLKVPSSAIGNALDRMKKSNRLTYRYLDRQFRYYAANYLVPKDPTIPEFHPLRPEAESELAEIMTEVIEKDIKKKPEKKQGRLTDKDTALKMLKHYSWEAFKSGTAATLADFIEYLER